MEDDHHHYDISGFEIYLNCVVCVLQFLVSHFEYPTIYINSLVVGDSAKRCHVYKEVREAISTEM